MSPAAQPQDHPENNTIATRLEKRKEESHQFHLVIVKSVHRSEDQSVSVISGLHDKKNSLDGIIFWT